MARRLWCALLDLCLVLPLYIANFVLQLFDLIVHWRRGLRQYRDWRSQNREQPTDRGHTADISLLVHRSPAKLKADGETLTPQCDSLVKQL